MKNGPLHTKFRVLCHGVPSASELELGEIFRHGQTKIPLCTTLKYLSHQQLLTPIEIDNSNALGIVTSTVKPKQFKQ